MLPQAPDGASSHYFKKSLCFSKAVIAFLIRSNRANLACSVFFIFSRGIEKYMNLFASATPTLQVFLSVTA